MSDYAFTYDVSTARRLPKWLQTVVALGRALPQGASPEQTVKALKRQVTVVRRRYSLLREAGWHVSHKAVACQRARNCPPGALPVANRIWHCRYDWWCPWCCGRRALSVYRGLRTVLASQPEADPPAAYVLYEHLSTDTAPYAPPPGSGATTPKEWLEQLLDGLIEQRAKRLRTLRDAPGGYYQITVAPTKSGWWRFRVGVLLVAPVGYRQPEWFMGKRRCRSRGKTVASPTPKAIARAVIRVCRYPVGLLYGTPDQLKTLFRARGFGHFRTVKGLYVATGPKRRRLAACFGRMQLPKE